MNEPLTRQKTLYEIMHVLDAANVPGDGVINQIHTLIDDNARLEAQIEALRKRPDVERLYELLDEDRSQILSLIADACLDAGLEPEALGWRWLAERKKWPGQTKDNSVWGWGWVDEEHKDVGHKFNPASFTLPRGLHTLVAQHLREVNELQFFAPTARTALEAVVAAFVGGWREPMRKRCTTAEGQ